MKTCKACGAPINGDSLNESERKLYAIQRENAPTEAFSDTEEICDQCRIECTRLTRILELQKKPLTGREEVEIQLEHQALVARMSDQELEAHILDLDRKLAAFRIKAIDARRERADRERTKYAKFTPEEIEKIKAEQRLKRVRADSPEVKAAKSKREAAIEAMVKLGVSRDDAEKWFVEATQVVKGAKSV
jgi:hypothetical protein